jgi:cold-inducible RNA-binding protein
MDSEMPEGKRLYVGNLHFDVGERELCDAFMPHAGVEKVEIVKDKFTGQSRGFAFVELISANDAGAAIEKLNGAPIRGRMIRVQAAKPPEHHHNHGGSDGGIDDRRRRTGFSDN